MKVKMVSRDDISSSRKKSSKYAPLIDALDKLRPGGDAIQVKYTNDQELNSARNIVYGYNRDTGTKIKSKRDIANKVIFFFLK